MKARPFLAVVLAVTLLLAGLGLAGWWLVWQRSPLRLQHLPLTPPGIARFVPRDAPLALFLFTDGAEPVDYARAVAPARRRRAAADAMARLRDGAFAAAGLDYPSELASWLAPQIGLAVLDSTEPGAGGEGAGWLLSLRSRDGDGARRFLQRFWQTRSLAGTGLQVSTYRGMGLISGRGALLGRRPVPLATALVDDDLVLIASGRGVLEQALDVSQIDELNLARQPGFLRGLDRLGEGAALLVARSGALPGWLGVPLPAEPEARPSMVMAALRPEGMALRARALLDLPESVAGSGPSVRREGSQGLRDGLPKQEMGGAESLALAWDPAGWLRQPLIAPLIRAALLPSTAAGPLPSLVVAADGADLLVAEGPAGWLMGTPTEQPPPAAIEAELAAQGLIAAPLEVGDRSLTVWTRLSPPSPRGTGRRAEAAAGQLQASLAGWRSESGGTAWWGGSSLAVLDSPGAGRESSVRRRQIRDLDEEGAGFLWAMDQGRSRQLLRAWQPWQLLAALAGGGLEEPLGGLALAASADAQGLSLDARLEFDNR
jgi:hypothetical protein